MISEPVNTTRTSTPNPMLYMISHKLILQRGRESLTVFLRDRDRQRTNTAMVENTGHAETKMVASEEGNGKGK